MLYLFSDHVLDKHIKEHKTMITSLDSKRSVLQTVDPRPSPVQILDSGLPRPAEQIVLDSSQIFSNDYLQTRSMLWQNQAADKQESTAWDGSDVNRGISWIGVYILYISVTYLNIVMLCYRYKYMVLLKKWFWFETVVIPRNRPVPARQTNSQHSSVKTKKSSLKIKMIQ